MSGPWDVAMGHECPQRLSSDGAGVVLRARGPRPALPGCQTREKLGWARRS